LNEGTRVSSWNAWGVELRAIFISYRRHDSEGEAGRLFDDLVAPFGESSVFMDVAAIDVGRDFRRAIDESVATCGVLLALIGPGWLGEKNESGERRLDDPGDFVRMETACALRRDIPVIPVLVRGAKMPRSDQLPDDLKDLAYRNCVELTHVRWKSDVKVLIGGLRPLLVDPEDKVAGRVGSPSTTDSKAATGVQLHPAATTQTPSSPTATTISGTKSVVDVPCGRNLDVEAMARITKELARYIGPIAEIVVKRAAKSCSTVSDLRRTVAEEIDVSADRAKFLDACQNR
jgi:hypothetical protein